MNPQLKSSAMFSHDFYKKKQSSQVQFKTNFSKMALLATQTDKHLIRQQILRKYGDLLSFPLHDRTFLGKSTYAKNATPIETGYDAVIMINCKVHHITHIDDFCKEYFNPQSKFSYKCPVCETVTADIEECLIDAFAISYMNFFNKLGDNEAVIIREKQESSADEIAKAEADIKAGEQLITILDKRVQEMYILSKKKGQKLQIVELVHTLRHLQKSKQIKPFMDKMNSMKPCQVNLVCYYQKKRINNPLIHAACSPETHGYKVFIYSFEFIHSELNKEGAEITQFKCPYPGCSNQFTKANFNQNAIVSSEIRRNFYSEKKHILIGNFSNGIYNKNQDENRILNLLPKFFPKFQLKKNQGEYKDMIKECINIIKNMSMGTGKGNHDNYKYKLLKDQYEADKTKDQILKRYVDVKVSDKLFSFAPVRCTKCTQSPIQIQELWYIVGEYIMEGKIQCKRCKASIQQPKSITELYFFDTRFAKFLFLEQKAKDLYYDCSQDCYIPKLASYNGKQLSEKLIEEKRIANQKIDYSTILVQLDEQIEYVPFAHETCLLKDTKEKGRSYIFLPIKGISKQPVRCNLCNLEVQVHELLYDQTLKQKMKNHKNQFRYMVEKEPVVQIQQVEKVYRTQMNLSEVRNIQDLEEQNLSFFQFGVEQVYIYLKSYYNKVISQPIAFKRCLHPIETRICCFDDLVIVAKEGSQKIFKCRYYKCNEEYRTTSQVYRIKNLNFDFLNDKASMKKLLKDSNYWIKYNIETGIQLLTRSEAEDQDTRLYRNIEDGCRINIEKIKKRFATQYKLIQSGQSFGMQNNKEKNQSNQQNDTMIQKAYGKVVSAGNHYVPKIILQSVCKIEPKAK